MKLILCFVLLLSFSILTFAKTVSSTQAGGEWNKAATWESGIVPTENDDVVIKGIVIIKTVVSVSSITIKKDAKLVIDTPKDVAPIVKHNIELSGQLVIWNNSTLKIHGLLNRTVTGKVSNNGIIELGE
jgi:hypothetical protein